MKNYVYLIFLLFTAFSFAQEVTVTGKVVSKEGESLPGATIIEKDTNTGVVSDFNGNFEINVSSNTATLVVSFVGFEEQEVQLDGKSYTEITLLESPESLDEVVVKGFAGIMGKSRKRTESIQKTAESVTALNAKGIETAGVTDISSFSTLVPNMKFNTSQAVGVNFITVRGIPQIRGGEAPVAFVIDGVTIPDPSLLNQELYDLALVEVVKGPQGALYGKNAIGGAINIYTQEPTNTFSNKIKVGYGNGNSKLFQYVSSGALKKDKIFFRVSAQYKDTDGLLENITLDEKVDFMKDINLRGEIRAKISNNFTITGSYQYFNLEGGAAYFSVNPDGNFFDPGMPGGVLDPNPKKGNNVIVANELGKSDMKNNFGNIKMDYNTEKIKIQSITSYNKVKRSTFGDFDFLEYDDFTQNEITSTKTFNQEFRFQNRNSNSKLNWNAGGFYQNIEEPLYQDGLVRDYDTFEQFNVIVADVLNETRTFALFGFADYKITEKFSASVGFRYDFDKFSQEDYLFEVSSSRSTNVFQPKASISYQATETVLLFTNYGRGYRTGGFNSGVTDLFDRDFEDEITDNYEIGYKTSWWKNRFIFNGSLFYTYFKNQQQYILDLNEFIPGIYNYDESKILGFEIETRLRLTNFLDVFANYGYTNAEIVKGGTTGGDNGNSTDNNLYNGNKTPFVPVDNFSIGLESNFNITEELKFNGFLNLNNTGKTYWHESNLQEHTSDNYSLLDARIGLEYKKFGFELWGRNLLDTQYYQEFSPGEFFGSPDDVGWRGQPLTVGTIISFKF